MNKQRLVSGFMISTASLLGVLRARSGRRTNGAGHCTARSKCASGERLLRAASNVRYREICVGSPSPKQVAGWLKRIYPDDETHQVSHETIYRSLFIQARGALKKELMAHLRRTRGTRRSRHGAADPRRSDGCRGSSAHLRSAALSGRRSVVRPE